MSFVVGLTGGIGSGKTTVADLFAAHGAAIVDTDAIAHELTGIGGAALPEIAAAFGPAVLSADGALDRGEMRRRVFSDPAAKRRLEAILHPMIRNESDARCRAAAGAPYVMLVVPLLVETGGYRDRIDRVLLVDCDESTQIARVMARNGLARDEVLAILASQASRRARLDAANDVVSNEADMESLDRQVLALHARYLELSSAGPKSRILNADC